MKHLKRTTNKGSFSRIGEYFRKRRIEAGLTQTEVADSLGLATGQFISNWERGRSMPPMVYLPKLVKLYGLNRGEVMEIYLNEQQSFLKQVLFKKA